jgi:BirA family biotin operon repressor/biotin-[acetyl-CoA-carboxylase] ligase
MHFFKPEWQDRLASTNTELLSRAAAGQPLRPGFVLAAREQTAGRGRFSRRWVSRPGRDLAFSFLVATSADRTRQSSLPMAVALGVADALEDYGVDVGVKWPNDLLVGGCKICGILVERPDRGPGPGDTLVVGVGVNVNMEAHEATAIDRPATSILIETGAANPVEQVLDRILVRLPGRLDRWETGGFPALHDDWFARHGSLGDRVTVSAMNQTHSGVLAGFGQAGQLLLRGEDGTTREIWSGEVGVP